MEASPRFCALRARLLVIGWPMNLISVLRSLSPALSFAGNRYATDAAEKALWVVIAGRARCAHSARLGPVFSADSFFFAKSASSADENLFPDRSPCVSCEPQSRCGEMADATDLKSVFEKSKCGFESRHRHPLKRRFTREQRVDAGTAPGVLIHPNEFYFRPHNAHFLGSRTDFWQLVTPA